MECDVLVVGAGPTGSSAAIAAASRGARVVVWERKERVGYPVSCAGVISEFLTPLLPFNIPGKLLRWKNNEVDFTADDITIRRRGGIWTSYAIDRTDFDSWLAEKAVRAGAGLHLQTELTRIDADKDFNVEKATASSKNGEITIEPKVVIAADGADGSVSRKAGLWNEKCIMGRGLVYEFSGVETTRPDADQIFFGDFILGGYAHIFPTSKNTANIGVGSILRDADIEQSFQKFCELDEVKNQIRNARVSAKKSGSVPFSQPVAERQRGNILFAGSAAGQNMKPLVEGILPGVICGSIAGEAAAEHALDGTPLANYQEKLKTRTSLLFGVTDRYIGVLEELSRSNEERSFLSMMGLCSGVFSVDDFGELKRDDHDGIKRRMEEWNASRSKRLKADIEERLWTYYLRVFGPRKLFKSLG